MRIVHSWNISEKIIEKYLTKNLGKDMQILETP